MPNDIIREIREWQMDMQRWRGQQTEKVNAINDTMARVEKKIDIMSHRIANNKITITKIVVCVSFLTSIFLMILEKLL